MPNITASRLAKGIGRSEPELALLLQSLYPSGFPRPSPKDGSFDPLKILTWVVAQQELQVEFVSALTNLEDGK